ncbi:MAG: hypothetical protein HRT73_07065 [Flavobacteriales bacterium]|nr:hypothetical protein [Flavobacteriales bacterium]
MNWKSFTGLIIIIIIVGACSKDKDVTGPTIVVHTPMQGQQINGGDTIHVTATITDEQNVENVSVTVIDANDVSVLATVSKKPNTLTFELNISYFFDDLQLPSGEYHLKVSAFDGTNTTDKYISILFNETPRVKKGTFIISNSSNLSQVYFLDSFYSGSFYKTINGDYLGAAVNSYSQQLVYASKITGSINSTDLIFGGNFWNIPILNNSSVPFYRGFYFLEEGVYLGKNTGGIQGYDKNGNPNFHTQINTGFYMESALIHDNRYFVAEEQHLSANTVRLLLYWIDNGVLVQQTTVNKDIKGIYSKNSSTIILLVNDASSNGKILFYDIPSGGITSPFNVSLNQIDDCLEINNGTYLVVEGGDITTVNVNSFISSPYLTGLNASNIWFDELTNELYVASGNSLDIYDYGTKSLKGNYIHTDIIKDVVFWYNK